MSDLAAAARILTALAAEVLRSGADRPALVRELVRLRDDLRESTIDPWEGQSLAAALLDAARRELGPSADDLWALLLGCTTCGREHEFRPTAPSEGQGDRWTWADPGDGHGYATRDYLGPRLRRLRDAWNAEQSRRLGDAP